MNTIAYVHISDLSSKYMELYGMAVLYKVDFTTTMTLFTEIYVAIAYICHVLCLPLLIWKAYAIPIKNSWHLYIAAVKVSVFASKL